MPRIELGEVGIGGLNSDTPAQKQSLTTFARGLNMRPFDGSLQGVFDMTRTDNANNIGGGQAVNTGANPRNIYAMTQWTPTGEDTLNFVYLYETDSDGLNLTFQIVEDITDSGSTSITGSTAVTPLDDNARFNIDLFPFNDIVIANDGASTPRELRRITQIDIDNDSSLAGQLNNYAAFPLTGWIGGTTAQRLLTYNNRIIALNGDGSYTGSENLGNVSLIWSTPITALGTLSGIDFVARSTNSAGDDIVTESVGEILDAAELGEYLIVYKEDAVLQYQDSGNPLYLVGRLLFDDDGLYSPGCFADIGNGRHFVVGNYGIYLHDGGPNKENISRGRIEGSLYTDVDPAARDRAFVFHHASDKEVWVCYSSINRTGNTTGCDKAFCYNYKNNTWYKRDLPTVGTDGVRNITESELNGKVLIFAWGKAGIFQLGDERAGGTYVSSGWVQFLDNNLGDETVTKKISSVYPKGEASFRCAVVSKNSVMANSVVKDSDQIAVSSSDSSSRTFNPSTKHKEDYRLNGRYYDIELSMNSTINPKITGFDVEVSTGGKR